MKSSAIISYCGYTVGFVSWRFSGVFSFGDDDLGEEGSHSFFAS
jgi:hypothetical protein